MRRLISVAILAFVGVLILGYLGGKSPLPDAQSDTSTLLTLRDTSLFEVVVEGYFDTEKRHYTENDLKAVVYRNKLSQSFVSTLEREDELLASWPARVKRMVEINDTGYGEIRFFDDTAVGFTFEDGVVTGILPRQWVPPKLPLAKLIANPGMTTYGTPTKCFHCGSGGPFPRLVSDNGRLAEYHFCSLECVGAFRATLEPAKAKQTGVSPSVAPEPMGGGD